MVLKVNFLYFIFVFLYVLPSKAIVWSYSNTPPELFQIANKELVDFKTKDGLVLKVLRLGPKEGIDPVLCITGFASNSLYYLQTALELLSQGKTVYIMAPRGMGSGDYKASDLTNNEATYYIQNMSEDLFQVLDWIYLQHSKHKVTLMGHSLGGIIIRLAELGIRSPTKNQIVMDLKSRKSFQAKVALKVLSSSPSPISLEVSEDQKKEALDFLYNTPTIVSNKALLSPIINLGLELPFLARTIKANADGWFGSLDSLKKYRELIDTRLLSLSEFKLFIKFGTSDSVPADLVSQLYEMVAMQNYVISSDSSLSLDLEKLYFDPAFKSRVPSLIIGNQLDHLAPIELLKKEYEFLVSIGNGSKLLVLEGGHMNSMYGTQNISLIMHALSEFKSEKKSCNKTF